MGHLSKLNEIKQILDSNSEEQIAKFNTSISDHQIAEIESLLEEKLPADLVKLFQDANGQSLDGKGILFGHRFVNSDEIITQLKFSRGLVKSEINSIDNPKKSEQLIKKIISKYVNTAPKHKFLGFVKRWYKIKFTCAIGAYGGPYLYLNENTSDKEREHYRMNSKEVSQFVKDLHELEYNSYGWDELEFVVYSNGKYEVERKFYNASSEILFTCSPVDSIKKKYFHYKWLPIFSDLGGNYIGVDFDPDEQGVKGQIINFGRDEESMKVYSTTLGKFLDLIINDIKSTNSKLINSNLRLHQHLHEALKEL